MRIAVLSDTHNLLRREVLDNIKGCNAIIHGGDISSQAVLNQLRDIAPVYAVRGNNDKEWAENIPMSLDITLDGIRIFATHRKKDLPDSLSEFDLVIYGHSHRYDMKEQGNTILLNPGSCGPRRFDQAITMAIVEIGKGKPSVTRVGIPHTTR